MHNSRKTGTGANLPTTKRTALNANPLNEFRQIVSSVDVEDWPQHYRALLQCRAVHSRASRCASAKIGKPIMPAATAVVKTARKKGRLAAAFSS